MRPDTLTRPLMRLVALNGALGGAAGLLVTALLVGADSFGLHRLTLAGASPDAALGLVLLALGLAGLCAAACIATAVMLLGAAEADAGPGAGTPALVPVRVRRGRF